MESMIKERKDDFVYDEKYLSFFSDATSSPVIAHSSKRLELSTLTTWPTYDCGW